MKTSGTTLSATGHKGGLGDGLYDRAGARPDLDLDFARTKSLKDRVSKEDLITFTRSSGTGYGATYVDENGLVKRSPVNLIFDSEDLSTGTYAVYSSFNGAISTNAGTSPSGNSSDAFIGTGATGRYSFAIRPPAGNDNFLIANNTRFVISFFIKRLSGDSVERYVNIETANYVTWAHTGNSGRFDLENGTRVTGPQGSGAANITSGIEDVGDGWYRIHMSSITGTTINSTGFYLNGTNSVSNGAPDLTITSSQGWLVWGVQVEEGSVPTTYIPTSAQRRGAPRFTHDPVTKESKGLLIEQAATNLVKNKDASSSDWTKTGLNTAYLGTAPTGVNEANELIAQSDSLTKRMYHTVSSGSLSAQKYTYSMFLKKGQIVAPGNYDQKALIKIGQSGDKAVATVNLTNGTIDVTTGTGAIEDYGDNWYRATITTADALSSSLACNLFVLVLNSGGLNTYTGAGESIYFYGPQLEAGEITTSYIPTSGQVDGVTRSPDLVKIEGDNDFGTYRTVDGTEILDRANGTKPAFYTKSGLTAFVHGTNQPNPPTYAFRFFEFTGGLNNSNADLSLTANSNGTKIGIFQHIDTSHATEPQGIGSGLTSPTTTLGLDNKMAVRYQTDNTRLYLNGVEGNLVDSNYYSGIDARSSTRLCIGANGSSSGVGTTRMLNGTIKRLTFWKTPFTDSKLDKLTTAIT